MRLVWIGLACAALLAGCGDRSGDYSFRLADDGVADFAGPAVPRTGTAFAPASWAYLLQGDAAAALVGTNFDAVVMDYSKDGGEGGRYAPAQIGAMKTKVAGTRRLLAYLSIGEAEDYRFYFNSGWLDGDQPGPSAPAWLCRGDPNWPGDYKVQYWSAAWQAIVFSYLDKIV
jgi:cysteinyl-tRNA synthetase, unknown class